MSITWSPDGKEPDLPPIAPWRWPLIVLRGLALIVILLTGVILTVILRLAEGPIFGVQRPFTPYITIFVCRLCLMIIGLRVICEGRIMQARGAIVTNHASWLDIFVLNSRKRVYFVSKSEVARWPGIGQLARITGTVFITRDPRQAKTQLRTFEERLMAGHKLLFFPEGTSTDGMRVLPFKTTLFESFFNQSLREKVTLQPVSIAYFAPRSRPATFYGWWGDMEFGAHLLRILSATRQGRVLVCYHDPVKVSDFTDRKALARHLEEAVRAGMPPDRRNNG